MGKKSASVFLEVVEHEATKFSSQFSHKAVEANFWDQTSKMY